MSVLKSYFDSSVNQASPVQLDFKRVVNVDEDGNEFVTYEEVDYAELQRSLGTCDQWSLDALLKAGINPNFPIHTGLNTRLEGVGVVNEFSVVADGLLSEDLPEDE